MITVYFWNRQGFDLTGHVAVAVGDNHMSFHPIDQNWIPDIMGTPAMLLEYNDDIKKYGRPEKQISINWLNEDAITKKGFEIVDRINDGSLLYSLIRSNCCSIVIEMLCSGIPEEIRHQIGFSAEYSQYKRIGQLVNSISRIPMTHSRHGILELIREIGEDILLIGRNRIFRGYVGPFTAHAILVDFVTREFIWSPGDVEKMAADLARLNHR
jgi:hypothetical protein